MNNFKAVLLGNIIIKAVWIVCITVLVLHFDKLTLCWLYPFGFIFGYEYIRKKGSDGEED